MGKRVILCNGKEVLKGKEVQIPLPLSGADADILEEALDKLIDIKAALIASAAVSTPAPTIKRVSVPFADLPLISKLDSKHMKQAKELLEECADLTESLATIKERREQVLNQLSDLQYDAGLPGFRYGSLAYSTREEDGRKTLKKDLLVENGVSLTLIQKCTTVGKNIEKRMFKNLDKEEEKDGEA